MNSSLLDNDTLLELWNSNLSRWFEKKLKENHPETYNAIMAVDGKGMAEKLYTHIHGRIVCKCGANTTFVSFDKGYRDYCGPKCNSEERSAKRSKTNLEKYGVENVFQSTAVREKFVNTMREKHGVDNPSQIAEVIELKNENSITKWGDHWTRTEEVKAKKASTLAERYGVTNSAYIGWSPETKEVLGNDKAMVELWETHRSTEAVAHALGVSQHTAYLRLKDLVNLSRGFSYPQQQLRELIEKYYDGEIIENDRSLHGGGRNAKHVDLYLKDLNIAFEFCGLYYHSEVTISDKKYHQNKLLECEKNGVRLVTIFSDEWFTKRSICENRIKVILGQGQRTCHGRQTIIKEIPANIAREFLNNHHIQGSCNSPIRYGAYYNDKLVAVMTFSALRKSLGHAPKEHCYELVRFASDGLVTGVASKLFRHFNKEKSAHNVLSYSDRRWNTGGVYEQLGFVDQGLSSPSYWWVEGYKVRHHRFKFTKQALVKKGHDPKLTEVHIMKNIVGMDRIWDCGHQKYIWSAFNGQN